MSNDSKLVPLWVAVGVALGGTFLVLVWFAARDGLPVSGHLIARTYHPPAGLELSATEAKVVMPRLVAVLQSAEFRSKVSAMLDLPMTEFRISKVKLKDFDSIELTFKTAVSKGPLAMTCVEGAFGNALMEMQPRLGYAPLTRETHEPVPFWRQLPAWAQEAYWDIRWKLRSAFAAAVEAQGVTTTLRLEKGHAIDAACGQLRLKTEREMADAK